MCIRDSGVGYLYAHDYPNHYVRQQYLPDALIKEHFYEPTRMGYEEKIREHMEMIKGDGGKYERADR